MSFLQFSDILLEGMLVMLCIAWTFRYLLPSEMGLYDMRRQWPLRIIMGVLFLWVAVGFLVDELRWWPSLISRENFYRLSMIDFLTIPLLHIMLTAVVSRRPITWRYAMVQFLPFVVLLTLRALTGLPLIGWTLFAYTIVYFLYGCMVNIRAGIRYNEKVREVFSSSLGQGVSYSFYIIIMVSGLLFVMVVYLFSETHTLARFAYLGLSAVVWPIIGYSVMRLLYLRERLSPAEQQAAQEVVTEMAREEASALMGIPVEEKPAEDVVSADEVDSFRQLLKRECEDAMLYHRPDLTRDMLARALGTNHTYLSRRLTQTTGLSFYDYINGLRVEEAARLLTEQPSLSVEEVQERVGFRSSTTFYRLFRDRYNCTPAAYQHRTPKA